MTIAKEKIERIQRMEGYLNDYAKILEDTKKAVARLKEHQESYIQLRDYYSSQAYFDDLDLSNQADFPADLPCGVLSEDAVYDLLDEHFQMGVELLEIATKMIKER